MFTWWVTYKVLVVFFYASLCWCMLVAVWGHYFLSITKGLTFRLTLTLIAWVIKNIRVWGIGVVYILGVPGLSWPRANQRFLKRLDFGLRNGLTRLSIALSKLGTLQDNQAQCRLCDRSVNASKQFLTIKSVTNKIMRGLHGYVINIPTSRKCCMPVVFMLVEPGRAVLWRSCKILVRSIVTEHKYSKFWDTWYCLAAQRTCSLMHNTLPSCEWAVWRSNIWESKRWKAKPVPKVWASPQIVVWYMSHSSADKTFLNMPLIVVWEEWQLLAESSNIPSLWMRVTKHHDGLCKDPDPALSDPVVHLKRLRAW